MASIVLHSMLKINIVNTLQASRGISCERIPNYSTNNNNKLDA